MDVRIGKFMEERPLGHALVKISDLCNWSKAEQLPYDFQQIVGDSYQFVQAEFLFPIVSSWSTQHLTPEAAQRIMFKRGATMGELSIADCPSISLWAVSAEAHNVFERLFYEAVMAKKLRLLDGITRLPLEELPAESQARLVELGCVVQSAPAAAKAETEGAHLIAYEINRIQLVQLRDMAIEYLPAAQKARDNVKLWSSKVQQISPANYARKLVTTAIEIRCDATLPAVELAAAELLDSVCMWLSYDPSDPELADIDPTEHRAYSMRKIAEAAKTLAAVTGRTMAHLMPADAPAAKVEAVPDTSPSGDDAEEQDTDDDTLAALFDPVPVDVLEKMFPADGKWKTWTDRAARKGLIHAREGTAMYNPYKAGMWFVSNGRKGLTIGHCRRMLANNHLPDRSLDKKYLLTGEQD